MQVDPHKVSFISQLYIKIDVKLMFALDPENHKEETLNLLSKHF